MNKMLATYGFPPSFLAAGGAEAWREHSDSFADRNAAFGESFDSDSEDGYEPVRHRQPTWQSAPSKKRAQLNPEVTAYDMEDDPEDNCTHIPAWPQQQRALPSLKGMLMFSAPAPKPVGLLKPEYVKQNEEHQAVINAAITAAAVATAKHTTAKAALKAHTDEKVGVWNRRAEREAIANRLGREANEAMLAKKAADAAVEKAVKDSFLISSIVRGHKQSQEIYKKHQEALYALWDLYYGKHTPIKRSIEIWGRYDCRGEHADEETGITSFEFAPGTDLERLSRECQIGGHEWVRIGRENLLLDTAALKAMEPPA